MKIDKTIVCFENLIFWNCFFCVNRSFIIKSEKKKYCKLISSSIFIVILTINIYDFIYTDIYYYKLSFLILVIFELLVLNSAANQGLSVDALGRLDEKCNVDAKYFDTMKNNVTNAILLSAMSLSTDFFGMMLLHLKISEIVTYSIVFAAQDVELLFFAMIIESINLRLSKLKTEPVYGWSKVYRHVLVTAYKLNEEYTSRVSPI